MTKLDKNCFTRMADELENDLAKGRNNYPNIVEAMQLAQTFRYDGRVMGDVIISTKYIDASAYVTQSYKSENKCYKRKADEENSSEGAKDYSHIKCYMCKQVEHYRSRCTMLAQAKEQNQKRKEITEKKRYRPETSLSNKRWYEGSLTYHASRLGDCNKDLGQRPWIGSREINHPADTRRGSDRAI